MRRTIGLLVAASLTLALPAFAQELSNGEDPTGKDSVGAVDPATAEWTIRNNDETSTTFMFGDPGDVPFMGDWDCDGISTPGLYRQSDGFVYLRNSNTTGVADLTFFFGDPEDVPIAGDFNGDGCDTVSIYRPSEARFYIINKLGEDGKGLGFAEFDFLYGNVGDAPFVGDWTGDGIDTPGLRRPSDGFVYLRHTNTQGIAHNSYFYGVEGDLVFAGDWDADGIDTVGLYRPSSQTFFLRNSNSTGEADETFVLGEPGSLPVAGRFELELEEPPPIDDGG